MCWSRATWSDFYWPVQRLVVETDSYTYHGDRLSFERDHRRTAELILAGYEVRRVTRDMLEGSPEQVNALIRGALQAQSIKLTTK
jgi:very-short-patch-repair endonuclease